MEQEVFVQRGISAVARLRDDVAAVLLPICGYLLSLLLIALNLGLVIVKDRYFLFVGQS